MCSDILTAVMEKVAKLVQAEWENKLLAAQTKYDYLSTTSTLEPSKSVYEALSCTPSTPVPAHL